ncbi:MAG: elongation factor Ts [Verrucomicrobiales bacterium]|nr:elongation factor Ts [Verrucomicrobiales bacterium]
MAEITAALVKTLRDKTNAGMMDCQRALKETNGDVEAAMEYLRKKGIVGAAKRQDREAKEGVIHAVIAADGRTGVLVEVNCETDFVAKNENFRAFVDSLAQQIAKTPAADDNRVETFTATPAPDGRGTVEEYIKAKIAEVGENIVLRRFRRFTVSSTGLVQQYIHMAGRVGVLIDVSVSKAEALSSDALKALVKDLTLQIAASSPEFLQRADVPDALRSKEEEIQRERMKDQLAKKPENIQQKIVEGSMGKFYSQICLLEQAFIKDPDKTIEDLIKDSAKAVGDTVTIHRFARFAVGEEIKV